MNWLKVGGSVCVLALAAAAVLCGCAPGSEQRGPEQAPQVGASFEPSGVDWDHPVYATQFDSPQVLDDWRLEGGRQMSVADGHLVLQSDTESVRSESVANHLVCWLNREVPADFLLEFSVRPQNRHRGLNIVFFNARGINGESIFDPSLQPRDGTFAQYHSGDLNSYHVSYWAATRGSANLRKNHGFHLVTSGEDFITGGAPDQFQTVRLYKRGGAIRMTVDGRLALAYDDDGRTYGPVHSHSGWIGLRQMAHTHRCEYDHLVIYPLLAE